MKIEQEKIGKIEQHITTEVTFQNIVGTINLSELWDFKRNPELNQKQ